MERNARFELTVHSFLPTMETGSGHETHLCIPLRPVMSMVLRDIPKLMDEPTSGLDYKNMESVAGILSALSKRGKAILVISHDNELLMKVCSRIIRVDERASS